MFRPPPTVIEIGTDEDIQQFEEMNNMKSPASPITAQRPRPVFESPEFQSSRQWLNITTPIGPTTLSFDSPM